MKTVQCVIKQSAKKQKRCEAILIFKLYTQWSNTLWHTLNNNTVFYDESGSIIIIVASPSGIKYN